MATLYRGPRARQIDRVGLFPTTGTGTAPGDIPGTLWFGTDCGQTNCARLPVMGRLIDFKPDGTPVYGVTEACHTWLFGGTPGYVQQENWPPLGISRTVKVKRHGSSTCGRLNGDFFLAYDDINAVWQAGGDIQLSVFAGVLTVVFSGCVDPPQVYTFTKDDPEVCIYPLVISPVAVITDAEGVAECCDCDADEDDPAQLQRVSIHGYHPSVHAARLIDVVNGVEKWMVATDCCPPDPIPCCCFDGDEPPALELIVEVVESTNCPTAVGAIGSLVWLPDLPWAPGQGGYLGSITILGILIELFIDCIGSTGQWGGWRLLYNRYIDWPGDPCDDPTGGGPESPGDPNTWSEQAFSDETEDSCVPFSIVWGQVGSRFVLGFPPCEGFCEEDPIGNPGVFNQGEVKLRVYRADGL